MNVHSGAKSKLVISGTEYPYRPLVEVLDVAERLDIRNLELWIPHNFRLDELPQVKVDLAKRNLRAAVISTWTQLNRPGDVAPRLFLLRQSIEAARVLHARSVNTYFGSNPERTPDQAIRAYRENIMPCIELAEKEGIYITLENEFDVTGNDITRRAEQVKQLVESIDSPCFRVNFDPCNFYFAGEEPYPWAYNLLKSHIGYVHLKDGMKYSHTLHGPIGAEWLWKDLSGEYICCPMGNGALPYESILEALQRDGYEGLYGLEPHVPVERLFEVFKQSLNFIQLHLN